MHGILLAVLGGVEAVLHKHHPGDQLHQQGALRGLRLGNELPSLRAVLHTALREVLLLVLLGEELQGLLEPLDAFVQIGLHLAQQRQRLREGHVLLANAGVHACGVRAVVLAIGELQGVVVDGDEELGELWNHLRRLISVAEHIQQIVGGHEVEAREGTFLAVHEVVQGLLTHLQRPLHLLQLLEDVPLVAELLRAADLGAVQQDFLHVHVDAHELVALLRQLFLHLVTENEEVLQEDPRALNLRQQSRHLRDVRQGLLPGHHLGLKGGQESRGEHVLHLNLMLLQHLELVVSHLHEHDFSPAVRVELEVDVSPLLGELLERVLHLHLLLCLVRGILHEVGVLVELQVPHIPQEDFWRDRNGLAALFHELRPVPSSHGGVTQLTHQGAEDRPLLHHVLNAHKGIALAVHFHLLQLLEEGLDLILHIASHHLAPLHHQEALGDLDTLNFELPQALAVGHVFTHGLHQLLGVVQLLRVVEVGSDVEQVLKSLVEVVQVRGDVLQPLLGELQATLVDIVGLLFKARLVRLELVLKVANGLLVELTFLLHHGLNLFLFGHDVLLQLLQVGTDLLELLQLLIGGQALALQLRQSLHHLVLSEDERVFLVVHVLDVVHDLDQVHHISILKLGLVPSVGRLVELVQALERGSQPGRDHRA
mmetsp:Transcript_57669/g.137353  ORF Transcript_57669/g.137353 Transcript_57669/m.137353 type:complete len:653 (+) Transcript_57669:8548-10506(+)